MRGASARPSVPPVATDGDAMPAFLAECYLPHASIDDLRSLADRAGSDEASGHLLALIGSDDDTAFCLFDAESEGDVVEAGRRGGISFQRVTSARYLFPGGRR